MTYEPGKSVRLVLVPDNAVARDLLFSAEHGSVSRPMRLTW